MNDKTKRVAKLCGFLFLAALIVGLAVQPLSAQVIIPEGATIDSAHFWIFVSQANGQQVNLYRITNEWAESVVTYNSFMNSYDDSISWGSFTAGPVGWKDIDITNLVRLWADHTYPNYGVAMVQPTDGGDLIYAHYHSSNYPDDPTLRPKLVIDYTYGGQSHTVIIQRPGSDPELVVDTFLNPQDADSIYGLESMLRTIHLSGLNKYSLVRFIFSFIPPPPPGCPGTGTPGYWMNHREAWPTDFVLQICGVVIPQDTAIEWMRASGAGDKTYTLFAAWAAAKLNAAIGCATECPGGINIAATIAEAEAWLCIHPVGSYVQAGGRTSPWRTGEPLYILLDQYNNGLLCVPHRD
jgi:hypothetical protein